MGRLTTARARWACTLAYLVLHPLAAWVSSSVVTTNGTPALSLSLGLVVAFVLTVGPWGGVAVAVALVVELVGVGGHDLALATVAFAAAQAGLAVAAALLLERRFRHHGPVRSPIVMVEFVTVAAVLLPLGTQLLSHALVTTPGDTSWVSTVVHHAVSGGLGVLSVTAGLRMLVMGERARFGRPTAIAIGVSSVATAGAVLATPGFGGAARLVDAQILLVPVLVLALLAGTAAFSIGLLLSTVAVLVPLALLLGPAAFDTSLFSHVNWWIVLFAGLLLATDGDRRRATAAEFRTLFEHSGTPTVEVNLATGAIILANAAMGELVDQPSADLVGGPVRDLFLVEEEVATHLEVALSGGVWTWSGECNVRAGVGVRWVRCTLVRVDVGGPQPDVLQVQLVDLTEQRAREEALNRSNQALEAFGRRVTHDLKQPLAAIAGYASTLREHAERLDPAMVDTMHDRLDAVARRAVTQLDDTFRSASLISGTTADVKLHEIVASVVGVVDIDLAEARGTVDTALAVQRLQADPAVLRQVLLNLVTNSLKYAQPDVPPRVRVASRVRGAGVELTVTDNGLGIPADDLERAFERGTRLAPDVAGGRGHGLADSRDLAEAAGGWLRAEPWADGARFVLWLPDARVAGAAPATRVLLVEDDPDTRSILVGRLTLESSLELVGTATSIVDAVARTRALRPDVVLLDRWLADGDGLDAVLELSRAHPDVRILLLTSDLSPEHERAARAGGVLRTLDKGTLDASLVTELANLSR